MIIPKSNLANRQLSGFIDIAPEKRLQDTAQTRARDQRTQTKGLTIVVSGKLRTVAHDISGHP